MFCWIPVDMTNVEPFEGDAEYRMKIDGSKGGWWYATTVSADALTIRICQAGELGAILSGDKSHWVAYTKGAWGTVESGPNAVLQMQIRRCPVANVKPV